MSWWDRLLGRELPLRTRPPEGELAGATKKGVKQGVWIEKGDGEWSSGLVECIYRDGVRQGPYRFWRDHLAERGTFVAGEREGEMERFTDDGQRLVQVWYRAGKLHGPARAWNRDGTLIYEREYRDDQRWSGCFDHKLPDGTPLECVSYQDGALHGPWSSYHKCRTVWRDKAYHFENGGEPKLAGEYRHGARAGLWRWHRTDGTIAAECDFGGDGPWRAGGAVVTPADDDDLERWVALADGWSRYASSAEPWHAVESLLDRWPEERRAQALVWIGERIAEHPGSLPARTTGGVNWGRVFGSHDDPRTWVVDGLSTDHNDWDAECAAHVAARAPVLRELDLCEVDIRPDGVDALFPRGTSWPKLQHLSLYECGSLARVVRLLAKAEWVRPLTALTLYDDAGAITSKDAAALIQSPRLVALRRLHLGPLARGRSLAQAVTTSPLFDQLEHLKLDFSDGMDNVLAALAGRVTPALRTLELSERSGECCPKPETLIKLASADLHPALESISLDQIDLPADLPAEIARLRPSLKLHIYMIGGSFFHN
jgi:antitoxin component YwqK of YwqJK toxin-antitoxin module